MPSSHLILCRPLLLLPPVPPSIRVFSNESSLCMPGSYAILLFTASDLASITSDIHSWVLFFLWLHPFILSGDISPLSSSNVLGTYQTREFIFQCPIFLPFCTIHGVLKARILKWFAIAFSSGPHFVRTLHHDPFVLGSPTWHGS